MKTGLTTSAVLHAAALTWGLWSLSGPKPLEAQYSEALPVEVVLSESFSGVKGEQDAPLSEKPAPKPTTKPQTLPMEAQNVGDNEVDLDTPPTPVVKPRAQQQTATAAPPPPAKPPVPREPPKPEPTVAEAPPPAPVPEPPKPAEPEPEAAPEPDPVEQAIAEAAELPDPAPVEEPKPQNVPRPAAKPTPPKPPEPKVAEKPPEPKKTEPKKSEPVRTASVETPKKTSDATKPRPEASQESEFNADDISALLNRQKSAGGGAKRSTETASLGSRRTTGATLTRGEKDALLDQLRGCWSIPSGIMEADSLRASVSFSLDASGKLTGPPRIDSSSGNRSFDESAVRAIRKCDQAGFQLPSDKQEEWAEIIIDFSPTDMF